MNAFSLSGLLTGVTCSVLIFIILKYRKEKIHRIFALFNLATALWGWGCFFIGRATVESTALIALRIAWVAGGSTAFVFFHFINVFCETKARKIVLIAYLWFTFVAFIILTPNLYIGPLEFVFNSFYIFQPQNVFYHFSLIIWIGILIASHLILFNFYRKTKDKIKRNQILWLLISGFIAFIGGVENPLVPLGIRILFPYNNFLIPLYCLLITYAILKHHLMDMNIVIKKSVVYSTLVALITAGYLIFVMSIGKIFQGIVGYQSFIVNLIAIFVIAIIFNPLRNKIQRFLDHRFFKGTLESLASEQERLRERLFHTEKLAYVGQLASSVAHEIRNPLTAIKTYVEYLPKKYSDPEFKDKFDKLIPKEIERINSVLCQLLNLAKPRSSEFRQVHMHLIIDSTLRLLENNLKKKKIAVKTNFCSDEIIIQGDEEQLRQVFLNLFLNAIEAMNEGGNLTIETRPDPGCLMLDTSKNKKLESRIKNLESRFAEISISDTGCGISEESLKKLFTPFFTTKKEGVGLGMVITKEIIEQHNGKIEVKSSKGKGTKFIIKLQTN